MSIDDRSLTYPGITPGEKDVFARCRVLNGPVAGLRAPYPDGLKVRTEMEGWFNFPTEFEYTATVVNPHGG